MLALEIEAAEFCENLHLEIEIRILSNELLQIDCGNWSIFSDTPYSPEPTCFVL
jgi:hypothetical protein